MKINGHSSTIFDLLSYNELHKLTNRCTPEMYSKYKLSIPLFNPFNNLNRHEEWTQFNFDMIVTSIQTKYNKSWSYRFH
jgi:hypothetical protein